MRRDCSADMRASASRATLGQSAFHGCTGLTSVSIPDSVTAIGDVRLPHTPARTHVSTHGARRMVARLVAKGYGMRVSRQQTKEAPRVCVKLPATAAR